jgi:glycosyltransferase involved in cell wall biosynthesis
MRVGYDEQVFLAQRHGGISRYVVSLVEAFVNAPSLDVEVVQGWRWSDNEHSNAAGLSRSLPVPELRGRLALATQGAYYLANTLPRRAARQADILHHTYFHPRFMAKASPSRHVCTVYDMIPELYPESFPMRDPHLAKRQYVASCDMVLCISESARADLVSLYGDPGVPMPVTHLGVGPEFRPDSAAPIGLPHRYLLFVGRRGGYKDFDVLAEAFAGLADREVALVAVGGGSFSNDESSRLSALGIGGRTHQVSVEDDELCRLYAHALAFVFPSRHEGFGLPTLEAMASGAPVVLADSSSHPEVGGDVARYFPVGDVAALTALLDEMIGNEGLRAKLGAEGVTRASRFTWEATATATAAAYAALLAR